MQTTGLLWALWRSWARGAHCFCCPKWALGPSYIDRLWAGYPSSWQRKGDLVGELCAGWGGLCKAACFHCGADHPTLPPVPKDMCCSDLDAKQGRWSPWRFSFKAAPWTFDSKLSWTFDSKFCSLSGVVVTSPQSTRHVSEGMTCRRQMRTKTWSRRCQETISNLHFCSVSQSLFKSQPSSKNQRCQIKNSGVQCWNQSHGFTLINLEEVRMTTRRKLTRQQHPRLKLFSGIASTTCMSLWWPAIAASRPGTTFLIFLVWIQVCIFEFISVYGVTELLISVFLLHFRMV